MASITPPDSDDNYPDRKLECQEALDPVIQALIADAVSSGWSTLEALDAATEVIKNLRLAYGEDPDPEDDPAPEATQTPDLGLDDPKQGP